MKFIARFGKLGWKFREKNSNTRLTGGHHLVRLFVRPRLRQFQKHTCDMLPWRELIGWSFGSVFWMNHKQHVWESRSKVRAVSVMVPWGFRRIYVLTFRAIKLYHRFTWYIRQPCNKTFRNITLFLIHI